MLAAADLPREAVQRVLQKYQIRTTSSTDFLDTFTPSEDLTEGLDESTAETVQVALRLGELVGPDPALHRKLHERRREGTWQKPEDLSRMSFDDWCDLIEEVTDPSELTEDEGLDGEQTLIEERAEMIIEALEEEYPSEFIRNHLRETEALGEGAKQLLGRARDQYLQSGESVQ